MFGVEEFGFFLSYGRFIFGCRVEEGVGRVRCGMGREWEVFFGGVCWRWG